MPAESVARPEPPLAHGVVQEKTNERERSVAHVYAHAEQGVEEWRHPDDVQPVQERDTRHGGEREALYVRECKTSHEYNIYIGKYVGRRRGGGGLGSWHPSGVLKWKTTGS